MQRLFTLVLAVLAFVTFTPAGQGDSQRFHVQLLAPAGGEIFQKGQEVTVTWQIIQEHNQLDWDIYYSGDGGATWALVVANIATAESSAIWTVSKTTEPTVVGRIKIVQDNDNSGGTPDYESESLEFTILGTSVATEAETELPEQSGLTEVYPNPFSSEANISFSVDAPEHIQINVFDLAGKEVAVFTPGLFSAGKHEILWRPEDIPSGVYFIRMTVRGITTVQSVVLNK